MPWTIVGDDARDTQEALVPPSQLKPLLPALEALILRMLSDRPHDRGSAGELAAAMEALADSAGAEADQPLGPGRSTQPADIRGASAAVSLQGDPGSLVLLPLAAGLLFLLSGSLSLEGLLAPSSGMRDGGTGGVADAAELPVGSEVRAAEPSELSLDMPKGPLPGQRRPPCPRNHVNIRGGCWVEFVQASPPCGESFYDWNGACYLPALMPPRPNTSDPR
ncbi:Protein kinase [Stigmatella aurantiaca DW4/3-1]|uniref:Protein kinase n=1 Tax=Stigmatella aurantiaca (strain DW4/3-1) TaxID=378806 RepID=Q08Y45_STIAD|nr:hypothetical protein [Stigmatella aurantiaca]ADO73034.1 Protein kinase [Stigmatella aurantiaca DW4/3-1]EAU65411.1 protein kinase [Stigmatella aurantiaca DW4/3-1]